MQVWGSRFLAMALVVGTLAGQSVLAADLDVAGAKSRYESQRRVADSAKSRFQTQETLLNEAQSRLSQAQQAEQTARQQLNREEQELSNLESRIERLEQDIVDIQHDVDQYQNQLTQVRSQLNIEQNKKNNLESTKSDLQRRIQQLNDQIADLEAKPEPPQDKIAELKQRRDRLSRDLDNTNSQLSDVDWKISDLRGSEQRLQDSLTSDQSKIRSKQLELSSAERDRDRQLREVEDARDEVRRRADQTLQAERDVSFVRPQYEAARNEWQREETRASELYAYYQEVVANYNAALNDVYRKADQAASSHASAEASERAPEKGKVDGLAVSNEKGTAKGNADAAVRDKAKGYQDGRAKASSDVSLAGSYKQGTTAGSQFATDKARIEDFPRGYNEALRVHFSGVPSQNASVDISETISSDPGGNGVLLKLAEKGVGTKPPPSTNVPLEPTYGAPAYSAPGVNVPAPLNAYYNPPCSGLVLAEFEPLCRNRYDDGYRSNFNASYQSIYRSNFKAVYESNVAGPYETALSKQNLASFAEGRSLGAVDQGLLDGFALSLDGAKVAEFERGKQVFRVDAAGGAHLVFRSAQLEETNGDGVFTPGESVRLKLVIDNYGLQATALQRVRLRVITNPGVGPLNFSIRELPALAADTRTTLQGVMAGPITTEYIGEKLSLNGVLEAQVDGKWVTLSNVASEAETHFPLELAEITLPKDPKVDETVSAKFKFVNRLTRDMEAGKAKLGTDPQFVAFPKPEVDLPALAAGGNVELPVDIKPGLWVGENTFNRFFADIGGVRQVLSKYIHIDRPVSVLLFDTAGRPVPNSTFVVNAGAQVAFDVQVKFHAKQSLPGPFTLRASKTSDPVIPFAGGATTAINYGGLSPGTSLTKMRVIYTVPTAYKGKKGWVMIQIDEAGKARHALMVYLDVR